MDATDSFYFEKKYGIVYYKLHLNTKFDAKNCIEATNKIQFSSVIIYTYQLTDLGLARASFQIVFLSVKRQSIQKLQHPPPPETPRAFELLKTGSFKSPSSRAKIVLKHNFL